MINTKARLNINQRLVTGIQVDRLINQRALRAVWEQMNVNFAFICVNSHDRAREQLSLCAVTQKIDSHCLYLVKGRLLAHRFGKTFVVNWPIFPAGSACKNCF